MSALSIGAGMVGQARQASAMRDYYKRQQEVTAANAAAAAANQWKGVQSRISQEREAANQAVFDASQEYLKASAGARVAASAGGVGGTTVSDVERNFILRTEEHAGRRARNLAWTEATFIDQMEAVRAGQQSRINQTMAPPIPGVNLAQGLGQLFGAGFDALNTYGFRQYNPATGSVELHI
jgi:hypothetical protein